MRVSGGGGGRCQARAWGEGEANTSNIVAVCVEEKLVLGVVGKAGRIPHTQSTR